MKCPFMSRTIHSSTGIGYSESTTFVDCYTSNCPYYENDNNKEICNKVLLEIERGKQNE